MGITAIVHVFKIFYFLKLMKTGEGKISNDALCETNYSLLDGRTYSRHTHITQVEAAAQSKS
jgi:hypothetical protein